jgi:hypothetical protein
MMMIGIVVTIMEGSEERDGAVHFTLVVNI